MLLKCLVKFRYGIKIKTVFLRTHRTLDSDEVYSELKILREMSPF